jgi:hypothetical protein
MKSESDSGTLHLSWGKEIDVDAPNEGGFLRNKCRAEDLLEELARSSNRDRNGRCTTIQHLKAQLAQFGAGGGNERVLGMELLNVSSMDGSNHVEERRTSTGTRRYDRNDPIKLVGHNSLRNNT